MAPIINWNCRGFRRNLDEIKNLIRDYDPMALCLQETYTGPGKTIDFRQYSSYHCHAISTDGRSIGGVTLMIKKSIPHRQVPLKSDIQAVAITFSGFKTITLCSIYLPPSLKLDQKDLENLVDQLPSPFMMVGDFNAHNNIWDENKKNPINSKGKIIENVILQHELCIYNDGSATYIHPANGNMSAIDLSLCSPNVFMDYSWEVHEDLCGSDHFPTFLHFNGVGNIERVQTWKFNKADWPEFQNNCSIHLTTDLMEKDEENKVDIFTLSLEFLARSTIPKTSTTPKKLNKPWWNDKCQNAVSDRNKALRLFKKKPNSTNLNLFKYKYAVARRIIRESMRNSWKNYVSKLNSRTPIKKTWDMIRKILGKKHNPHISQLKVNNSFITNKKDIADTIGDTISQNSSSTNYSAEFQRFKNQKEKNRLNFKSSNHENYNMPFTIRELKESLKSASDTAVGPDDIHYQILKHLPEVSLEALLHAFNDVWINNSFPDSWRQAIIIPIPKPGKDHTNPSNYRPIALTSCVCKTFERMVNKRLVFYLENHGILTQYQSGFRKSRSTLDQVIRLESAVREAFLRREHLVAVYFDLEKAYDTTWKHGIMTDLHEAGLRGRLPNFIAQFLNNRTFSVRIGATLSDIYHQEEGVPQGSILSVTLFSMKINSIVKVLSDGMDCSLYVDDFLICYGSKQMHTIERQLQQCLYKIQNWAQENGFRFSRTKTVCMHFCQLRKMHPEPELKLNDNQIPLVKEYKFLGIIFDSKMSFIPHIKYVKSKCQQALNLLKTVSRMDWGADEEVLLRLYRSHIRSKLDYGCVVYGSARKSYIQMLDTIHHQGLRICLGAFRTSPAESLYVAANEESLYRRRQRLLVQYCLKIKSTPTNPVFGHIYHPKYVARFTDKPKTIPTIGIRFDNIVSNMNVDTSIISSSRLYENPHWNLKIPNIRYDLRTDKKSQTNPLDFIMKFNDIRRFFERYVFIYSDGSKDQERVGSASVLGSLTKKVRLPDHASIFSAELHAIILSLEFVYASEKSNFVVCTDSLSSLQAIEGAKFENPFVVEILNLYLQLINRGKHIIMCWIPSHIGIRGNDMADKAAKEALELPISDIKIPYTDLYGNVKAFFQNEWQIFWNEQVNNKLHYVHPIIKTRHISRQLKHRRDEIIFCKFIANVG
jgi:ribonuclease HI